MGNEYINTLFQQEQYMTNKTQEKPFLVVLLFDEHAQHPFLAQN